MFFAFQIPHCLYYYVYIHVLIKDVNIIEICFGILFCAFRVVVLHSKSNNQNNDFDDD